MKISCLLAGLMLFSIGYAQPSTKAGDPWPEIKKEMRPWTRWWWMSSAVDEKNLDKVLTTYSQAGFGGVEVTPIYGAKDYESRYISFLSPQWMSMLNFTVKKAKSLGMGVDMNTGTGWPFGGPQVKPEDAASKLLIQTYKLSAGKTLSEKINLTDQKQIDAGAKLQALTAYNDKGEVISIFDKVDNSGQLNWTAPSGNWEIYAAFNGKTLQMVKRAAAGGEGLVMNHLNKDAVDHYLQRFDDVFAGTTPGIRAFFNDSYEVYNANWSPDLLNEFEKRRGYDLRLHLKELWSTDSSEKILRVKSDYRETMSEMLIDNMAVNWTSWAHKNNRITKYQAHGSPGNLLDLYAAADIPECEAYFGLSYFPIPGLRHDTSDVINPNSNPNVFKFASSAAHVNGKPLTSSETFVWQTDHFKTSLSQCKPEVERLFLNGINHVFYHGTTYSPADVPFPGWQFYASTNFTPSNSLWPQLSGLNNYITRCESVLQAGKPDNELLIYWPVYDCWAIPKGTDLQLSMHNVNEWLTPTAFNKTVTQLQNRGYSLDYVSDKMIKNAIVKNGKIQIVASGPAYTSIIIPSCRYIPEETRKKINLLVEKGAKVIFQDNAEVLTAVEHAGIIREELTDLGLKFIRRDLSGGKYYYIVNHTANPVDASVALNVIAKAVVIMDPQSSNYGIAPSAISNGKAKIRIQIQPGEALILRCYTRNAPKLPVWKYLEKYVRSMPVTGTWNLHFTAGGPEMPADQKLSNLQSWPQLPDPKAIAFSGTGEYSINFNLDKKNASEYLLDLGKVNESAHVWINGQDVGILWSIPFQARVGKYLKQGNNIIKIEVVNLMANRIRDMDIKGIKWRNYHEINFVNINYKPFDASKWEPMPSGLLGPVTITAVD